MLEFNGDSGLVKLWVSLIVSGAYTLDDVPDITNFRVMVAEVLGAR